MAFRPNEKGQIAMYTWKFRVTKSGEYSFDTTMSGYSSSECERALEDMYPGAHITCMGMC